MAKKSPRFFFSEEGAVKTRRMVTTILFSHIGRMPADSGYGRFADTLSFGKGCSTLRQPFGIPSGFVRTFREFKMSALGLFLRHSDTMTAILKTPLLRQKRKLFAGYPKTEYFCGRLPTNQNHEKVFVSSSYRSNALRMLWIRQIGAVVFR